MVCLFRGVDIAICQNYTCRGTGKMSTYLSNENFTCPKEQIMHKENAVENNIDPDQLASEDKDPHCSPYNMAL